MQLFCTDISSCLWLFFFDFVILAKLQLPHFGLYCSDPSLRKLSPQLPPNLFFSPPPTSTALWHCTTLGRRSVLLALSRRVNDCITNPFPISLHIMSYKNCLLMHTNVGLNICLPIHLVNLSSPFSNYQVFCVFVLFDLFISFCFCSGNNKCLISINNSEY